MILLIGMLIIGNMTISNGNNKSKDYVKYSILTNTRIEENADIPAWAVRKTQVIVRVGEWSGKNGKRVYIDEGVNWKNIPTDIPIHQDSKGHYIHEFDINKKIATNIYNELKKLGVDTQIQIANGRAEDLNAAGRIANESNPKLYLSIHSNCYNGKASGYFAMYNENDGMGKSIAKRLSNSITNNGFVPQNENRPQNGYIGEMNVLNGSTCGVLLEMGFFDNKEELVRICSDEYVNYVGSHLADEIKNVLSDYWKN